MFELWERYRFPTANIIRIIWRVSSGVRGDLLMLAMLTLAATRWSKEMGHDCLLTERYRRIGKNVETALHHVRKIQLARSSAFTGSLRTLIEMPHHRPRTGHILSSSLLSTSTMQSFTNILAQAPRNAAQPFSHTPTPLRASLGLPKSPDAPGDTSEKPTDQMPRHSRIRRACLAPLRYIVKPFPARMRPNAATMAWVREAAAKTMGARPLWQTLLDAREVHFPGYAELG